MKQSHRNILLLLLITIAFLGTFSLLANEKGKFQESRNVLTAEEIIASKANTLFASGKFEEALLEFKILAKEYPNDVVVKRYIGACFEHLKKYEEATQTFLDILAHNPSDLPSRQYLGIIYLKQGEILKSKSEFEFLANQKEEITFSDFAKTQLELIERLLNPKTGFPTDSELTSEQFLKTSAAQNFIKGDFESALSELQKLELSHPKSLLVKRYIGLSLAKLGRYDESIATLQLALKSEPSHIPLRYSLAQTYLQKKDFEAAKHEFQIVETEDASGAYGEKSSKELSGIKKLMDALAQKKERKWTFGVSSGAEHNSNATSESRVPEFGSQINQRAWKFASAVNASYEFFKKKNWSFKVLYNHYQAFHTHSLSQINVIANSLGINATRSGLLKGRPFIFQFGHSTSQTLVRDDHYSVAFTEYATAIYSPAEFYRIILSNRFFLTKYELEGLAPDITSRDGFSNVISWNNYLYLNRLKTFYYVIGFDYQRDQTQGVNYIRNSGSVRTGVHFPIYKFCEGETAFRFKESGFPKYSPTGTFPERHREEEYSLETGIAKKITERWSLNATYKLILTDSQYDLYTYTNHAIGFSVSYNY